MNYPFKRVYTSSWKFHCCWQWNFLKHVRYNYLFSWILFFKTKFLSNKYFYLKNYLKIKLIYFFSFKKSPYKIPPQILSRLNYIFTLFWNTSENKFADKLCHFSAKEKNVFESYNVSPCDNKLSTITNISKKGNF